MEKAPFAEIRTVAYSLMLFSCLLLLVTMGPRFFVPCTLFGAAGLAVLVLTLWVDEPKLKKLFYLLVGAAGTASLFTVGLLQLLSSLGRTPGGDGGGLIVPVLIGCPLLFLIASVGLLVCNLRKKTSGEKKP